jgi:hypothetical protein
MKPSKQCPQLACSRSRNTRQAHSPGAIEVGLDASQTASPDWGVGDGFSLDIPSHRMLASYNPTGTDDSGCVGKGKIRLFAMNFNRIKTTTTLHQD